MIQDIRENSLNYDYKNISPCPADCVLSYSGKNVLCLIDGSRIHFPEFALCEQSAEYIYLFEIDGVKFFLYQNEIPLSIKGFRYEDMDKLKYFSGEEYFDEFAYGAIVGYHLSCWYKSHKFCGKCGKPMLIGDKLRNLICPKCKNEIFTSIAPAIIAGVYNGDKLLLTKYANRDFANYALIGGYAEVGETIEQTVAREIFEETGLKVKNIRYYKSQPWGYSQTLLFGFWAELDGSDKLTVDYDELSVACWKNRNEIPPRENSASLTSEMIQKFIDGKEKEQ